jgi:hypothetical protein
LGLKFVYLEELGLENKTPDDELWRLAQRKGMIILTDNRNHKDETSLAAVIERENNPQALPVLTVARVKKLPDATYRHRVAKRLVEIIFELDNYRGTGRIFIP